MARAAFLAVRFFGLVVIVPIIEETFYRGFLLRYVTDLDDFRRAQTGTFSLGALGINVALFAFSHPEWLAAAIFALAMCGLLARTKNLFACIVAHAVTNLLLGLYVIHYGAWQYWWEKWVNVLAWRSRWRDGSPQAPLPNPLPPQRDVAAPAACHSAAQAVDDFRGQHCD